MKNKRVKIILIVVIIFILSIITIFYQIHINSNKWYKYLNNPVIGNEQTGSIFDPNVIKDSNGIYRMYVSWRNKGAIALSTSKDGINWSPLKIVLDKDLSTGWEDIVNRATVIYKDGMYHMWYTGQSNNISKIGYATSIDGYTFQKTNTPVIIPEQNWELQSVMNPYVLYDTKEGIFKMWYAAGETYEPDVLAYATSKDGLNWSKYKNNPIFKPNEDKETLDMFKVGACEVHKVTENEYIMFYIGYTDIDTARVFVAKSKDGITNWTRYGKKPIISPTKNNFDSDACYKPSAIWDEEEHKWMVWYNGRSGVKEYIGLVIFNNYNFLDED